MPDINEVEDYGQGHKASLSKQIIKTIMMYHHTKFELPNAFHKNYY